MRPTVWAGVCLASLLSFCAPEHAQAQFRSVGERYVVEILGGEWFPPPNPVIVRDAPSVPGTEINFAVDLGVTSRRFSMWRLGVRLAQRQKARVEWLPIRYSAETVTQRSLIYDGITFAAGLPTVSELEWLAWRFGYEYDLIAHERGFVGIIAEVKYAEVKSRIANAEAVAGTRTRVAIPGVGAIGRVYLVRFIAITGEVSGINLGGSGADRRRYLDYDVSGTINFNDSFGLQGGTRSMDMRYRLGRDAGSIEVREKYFAAVVRF